MTPPSEPVVPLPTTVTPNPALPWATNAGGTITLDNPVTIEQLLSDNPPLLVQTQSNGQDDDNCLFTGSAERDELWIDAAGVSVFSVLLQNGGRTLILYPISGVSGYNLKSVTIAGTSNGGGSDNGSGDGNDDGNSQG